MSVFWLILHRQLSFWVPLTDDPCFTFVTLYMDVIVDSFFLVSVSSKCK